MMSWNIKRTIDPRYVNESRAGPLQAGRGSTSSNSLELGPAGIRYFSSFSNDVPRT